MPPRPAPAAPAKYGGYRITVITPVCGTGNPGSIPGSRPNTKDIAETGNRSRINKGKDILYANLLVNAYEKVSYYNYWHDCLGAHDGARRNAHR